MRKGGLDVVTKGSSLILFIILADMIIVTVRKQRVPKKLDTI